MKSTISIIVSSSHTHIDFAALTEAFKGFHVVGASTLALIVGIGAFGATRWRLALAEVGFAGFRPDFDLAAVRGAALFLGALDSIVSFIATVYNF